MDILNITENKLQLSTGLLQKSFAKTDFSRLLGEKSLILHVTENAITSETYLFDGTKIDENEFTLYEGMAFFGKTLSDILEKASYDESDIKSLTDFTRAVDYILSQDDSSGTGKDFASGGKGIIIKSGRDKTDILFISAKIFESCAENHKSDYYELSGKYRYKGLDNVQQLCFLRAVVAYRALTAHFPFENRDTSKRQEDIFDENFIPLSLYNPEISQPLAKSIESSLKAKISQKVMAGKKNLTDAKAENKRLELLEEAKAFDSQTFRTELEKKSQADSSQDDLLAKKRQDFTSKMSKKLKTKRFLRRNKNRIITAIAVCLFAAWGASGFAKQNAKLVTTKGMTSTETTQAFYSMIHRMDVPNLQEIISGKQTKDLFTRISAYYVSSKQRLQVSPDSGTVTPAKWFFYRKASKNWMFGISKLKIDGEDFASDRKYSIRKDRPLALTEENGNLLQEGSEISHVAEYYLIEQAESKIHVQKNTDKVTLRYTGKRWRVVSVKGTTKTESIKAKAFAEEYYNTLGRDIENQDEYELSMMENPDEKSKVREAVAKLREKYDWIPAEEDMIFAAEELFDDFGSIEAEKYLREAKAQGLPKANE